MASVFDHYGPKINEELSARHNERAGIDGFR